MMNPSGFYDLYYNMRIRS